MKNEDTPLNEHYLTLIKAVAAAPSLRPIPVELTGQGLMLLRNPISNLGLPPEYIVVAGNVCTRMMSDDQLIMAMEPCSMQEAMIGGIAVMYGMTIVSDSFLEERILEKDTIAVVSYTPHNGITIRKAKVAP